MERRVLAGILALVLAINVCGQGGLARGGAAPESIAGGYMLMFFIFLIIAIIALAVGSSIIYVLELTGAFIGIYLQRDRETLSKRKIFGCMAAIPLFLNMLFVLAMLSGMIIFSNGLIGLLAFVDIIILFILLAFTLGLTYVIDILWEKSLRWHVRNRYLRYFLCITIANALLFVFVVGLSLLFLGIESPSTYGTYARYLIIYPSIILAWISLIVYLLRYRDQNWKKILAISVMSLGMTSIAGLFYIPIPPIFLTPTVVGLNFIYLVVMVLYMGGHWPKIRRPVCGFLEFSAGFLLSVIVGLVCFLIFGILGLNLTLLLIPMLAVYLFFKKRKNILALGTLSALVAGILLSLPIYWMQQGLTISSVYDRWMYNRLPVFPVEYILLFLFPFIFTLPWFAVAIYLLFFRNENWERVNQISLIYLILTAIIVGFIWISTFGLMDYMGINISSIIQENTFSMYLVYTILWIGIYVLYPIYLVYPFLLVIYVLCKRRQNRCEHG
jgi:hypothetical protein